MSFAALSCALSACALDSGQGADDDTSSSSAASDPTSYDAALTHPAYVHTPSALMHRDCVHEVPEGATVDDAGDGTVTLADGQQYQLPPCTHPAFALTGALGTPSGSSDATSIPAVNGWVIASFWTAPTWMRKLVENFTVPSNPARGGATVFFFPSFEDLKGTAIVQPVLQWDNTGVNEWTMASWYAWVDSKGKGHGVHSTPVAVRAGDSLFGELEASGCRSDGSNCAWTITTRDRRLAKTTSFVIHSAASFRTVQGGVLEVDNVTGCNQLPADRVARFSGLQVFDGGLHQVQPKFSKFEPDNLCKPVIAFNPTATTITWSSF